MERAIRQSLVAEEESHILLQELSQTDKDYENVSPEKIERIKLLIVEKTLLRFENQGLMYGLGEVEEEDDD